ncbi:cardiolipin synthase [Actinomyces minihominis]|uniref:cardiolipin synthase n=1 Tax=Actinomyces minihominis TaxID=2002838 RepID=UPI000C0777F3|nr:cardiolipin synthase [Actinomyces minihominis]
MIPAVVATDLAASSVSLPAIASFFFPLGASALPPFLLILLVIVDNAIRITALFIVPPGRKPGSATAWLMAIFLLPIPGIIVFAIIGNNDLPKAREAKQVAVNDAVTAITAREDAREEPGKDSVPTRFRGAVTLGQALGAQPMLAGNTASVTVDYEGSFADMARAIDLAQDYVHAEFYILQHDETTDIVFTALQRAKERGVEVRVLLDHISAVMNPLAKKTRRSLDKVATQWAYMLPVRPWRGEYQRPDLRNHRKLLIIDGKTGFMGSQNMVDSSYNKKGNIKRGLHWRDIMVHVSGPVVLGLEAVFEGDWYMETGEILRNVDTEMISRDDRPGDLACQIVPSGPAYGDENNLQVFVSLMYGAKKRISITSPYFVPDASIMHALRAATARGVEVELFVSETGDQAMVYHAQRSYYSELLRAGVKIWMFRPPYILHSKHFTIDDEIVVIGSSNMDERSFNLNMEVSMIVHGEEFTTQMDGVSDYYRENSRELTAEEWAKQPWRSHLLDNLARLTSALQ